MRSTVLRRCRIAAHCFALTLLAATAGGASAQPAPGASPRIDAIRKAGELRVGVLQNAPWLMENTTGQGEPWSGPAWLLATEYARQLGVKLRTVPVSHETKVPVLAANQVDMTISPLGETPERLKVVDFVIYSATSVCMFGRADNAKLAKAASVDDLNQPDVTIAYFTGGAEEGWVKERFPKAKLRAVASSGATAAIEEIMARRADQPRAMGRPAAEDQGTGRAAEGQQLPVEHREGLARRARGGQEPAGVPELAARGRQGAEGAPGRGRGPHRRHAQVNMNPSNIRRQTA